jgi:hypothetical protein
VCTFAGGGSRLTSGAHPCAACAKRSTPKCPSYAIAADDTSCAYCVNKTRLITSGPNTGKCAARCKAGELVYKDGTCGSCPPGKSIFNAKVCLTDVGELSASPIVTTASEISPPALMKAPALKDTCPEDTYDCGPVCVKLPAPVLGNLCYRAMEGGGADKWPKCD